MLLIHVLLLCLIYCGNSAVAAEMNFDNCEAADVLFLIDKVRTIGLDLMEKEKQLVKNIVSQLPLSSNLTRVAVWSFSKGKKQEFGLDQEQTIDAALKAVDGIVFGPGINRYTHRAIRLANKYLNKHARDGVHRIIVYVTVGAVLDPEESLQSADKARKDGIMLFALGVGNDVDSAELSQLAYKNQEPYLLNNLEATNYLTHNLKD